MAILEVFGKGLTRTDFQKLLFLYCQVTGKNHYDFFPHHFGAFSFLAHQDQVLLTSNGYLADKDDVELASDVSVLKQIKTRDQIALRSFSSEYGNLNGKTLLRHVYVNYPHFTRKSTILNELFSAEELERIKCWWNTDRSPCLFTIGYEGISIDAYLNRLVSNNVELLIDVRKNPVSMKYGFSKSKLRSYLQSAGIEYLHFPQLGIPSELRQNLSHPNAYKKLFTYYSSKILPRQRESLEELKGLLKEYRRTALTCFEKEHFNCHRHRISDYLEEFTTNSNIKTVHL